MTDSWMDRSSKAQPGPCRGPGQGAHGSSPQGTVRLPASQGTSLAWLQPRAGSAQPWHSTALSLGMAALARLLVLISY